MGHIGMQAQSISHSTTQSSARTRGKRRVECGRSALLYTLLSILTLSVYHYWFFSKLTDDINTICRGDGDETPDLGIRFLLDLATFGVYKYVWYAHLADRMCENAPRYGVKLSANGDTLFLWWILVPFGVGRFIAMFLLFRDANRLAAAYNAHLQKSASRAEERRPAVPQPVPPREGGLFGLAGNYAGFRIPLAAEQPVVLGRDPTVASIVINDGKLSRKHCTVCYHSVTDDYSVIDHSRNGVSINDQRLPAETELHVKSGTVIVLAHRKNAFQLL